MLNVAVAWNSSSLEQSSICFFSSTFFFFSCRAFLTAAPTRGVEQTTAGSLGPAGVRKDIGQRWRERPAAGDGCGRELAAQGSVGRASLGKDPRGAREEQRKKVPLKSSYSENIMYRVLKTMLEIW